MSDDLRVEPVAPEFCTLRGDGRFYHLHVRSGEARASRPFTTRARAKRAMEAEIENATEQERDRDRDPVGFIGIVSPDGRLLDGWCGLYFSRVDVSDLPRVVG